MAYLTGFHAIEEHLRSGKYAVQLLVAKAGPRARELAALAVEKHVRIERTGSHELDRIAKDHRGIALEIESLFEHDLSFEERLAALRERPSALAVILDEITDPHNYGAIIRSCEQFGADLIVTRNRRTAKHSDVIARASAGTAAWAPIAETPNLVRALEDLKEAGFWIYGADMSGTVAYNERLNGKCALVLGSEGGGISRLLRERCDHCIAIPSLGRIDSLNVSVAAGILLYEIRRQQAASR